MAKKKISNLTEAKKLLKGFGNPFDIAFVSEDGYVFWESSEAAALEYTSNRSIELFKVKNKQK